METWKAWWVLADVKLFLSIISLVKEIINRNTYLQYANAAYYL